MDRIRKHNFAQDDEAFDRLLEDTLAGLEAAALDRLCDAITGAEPPRPGEMLDPTGGIWRLN